METKPYDLQSPEQIAKDYGGNKQKIAEAMQMGILDPTAGTLAGMFIDRMRSAAQQEAAPQQSVAQQVFAPPAPPPMAAPAGLGATPEAAAMPPMNATPPMGAAPPQEMPMMAMGGMVPPYASGGGLSDMPIPDGMFDEPSNGGYGDGYAGGGMVAFAGSGLVKDKNKPKGIAALLANPPEEEEEDDETYSSPEELAKEQQTGEIVAAGEKAPKKGTTYKPGMAFQSPNFLSPFKQNVLGSSDLLDELSPRRVKRAKQLEELLEGELSPEAQKSRAKEDMDMALIKAGVAMANTPGSLLQSATAGAGAALPGFEAAAKERRGAKRSIVKELLSEERLSNKELADRFNTSLDMVVKGVIPLEEAFQDRNFKLLFQQMSSADQRYVADSNARAGIITTGMSVAGQKDVSAMQLRGQRIGAANAMGDYVDKVLALDGTYQGLLATNPAAAADYRSDMIRKNLDRQFGPSGGIDFSDMNK